MKDRAGRMGDSRDIAGGFKRARRNYQVGNAFAVLVGYAGHEDPESSYRKAADDITALLATSGPEFRRLVALAAGVVQMIALDVAESRPEWTDDGAGVNSFRGATVDQVIIDEVHRMPPRVIEPAPEEGQGSA